METIRNNIAVIVWGATLFSLAIAGLAVILFGDLFGLSSIRSARIATGTIAFALQLFVLISVLLHYAYPPRIRFSMYGVVFCFGLAGTCVASIVFPIQDIAIKAGANQAILRMTDNPLPIAVVCLFSLGCSVRLIRMLPEN